MSVSIHPTADVSPKATVGDGSLIWHQVQIRENARLGTKCTIGRGVYIDVGVLIGNNVKIQNYSSVFHGVTIEDGVFVGPHVCFTNDMRPRAVNKDGSVKMATDWVLTETLVKEGAAIGAGSVIRCGVTIGEWALTGVGSVVTRDIPGHGLVYGNPARLHGFVCRCADIVLHESETATHIVARCRNCREKLKIRKDVWQQASK